MDEAEREHYWKHGFTVLRKLFDASELSRFERRFVDIATGSMPRPEGLVLMQDVSVAKGGHVPETPLHGINKILSFEEDPVLFDHSLHPAQLAAVRSLIGPDLVTISTNVFNKPPGLDGRHPFHQDLRYFALRPADQIVACWTAISPCRRENGCLAVVPGSHRSPLRSHELPSWEQVNFGYFAAEGDERERREWVEMEPGDTVFFHPLLLHGSGRNRSGDFRRAISTHYASAACERPATPRKRAPVMVEIPSA